MNLDVMTLGLVRHYRGISDKAKATVLSKIEGMSEQEWERYSRDIISKGGGESLFVRFLLGSEKTFVPNNRQIKPVQTK